MNSLSLMLYLSDIVSGISGLVGAFGVIGGFLCTMLGIIILIRKCDPPYAVSNNEGIDEPVAIMTRVVKWLAPISVVLLLILIFMPSQRTMYMIAASESAESVVNTPEGKQILDALQGITP